MTRVLLILLTWFAAPAFAKFESPRKSNTLLFQSSCAHALDSWNAVGARVREMQRWLGAYLRDPNPALPARERLANAFLEMHDEAVDRLVDLPKSSRKTYAGYLWETGLADGRVPDRRMTERFLFTLGAMDQLLRTADVADLHGAAGAAVMLAVMGGVIPLDDMVITEYDVDGLWSREAIIEPADYSAFVTVQDTILKLRRRGRVELLSRAFVPRYRYQREALLETIGRLTSIRDGLPRRVTEDIQILRELRSDFVFDDRDQDDEVETFARAVMVLREIEGFASLASKMDALGMSVDDDPFAP